MTKAGSNAISAALPPGAAQVRPACPECRVRSQRAQSRAAAPERPFSEADKTVITLVAKGFTNKEIAGLVGHIPGWVNDRLKAIFARLDVNTRAEVAVYAAKQGWV